MTHTIIEIKDYSPEALREMLKVGDVIFFVNEGNQEEVHEIKRVGDSVTYVWLKHDSALCTRS